VAGEIFRETSAVTVFENYEVDLIN